MKMKPEHYAKIKAAMLAVKSREPNMTPTHYAKHKIGRDTAMRHRWDMYGAATIDGNKTLFFTVDTLYNYLNDNHIDTALRNIVKEIF